MNNNSYNSANRLLARDLRHHMTKAEACLWKYALKERKMRGYSFKRQRPILGFIADFACLDLKLVIEVDGYSHFLDKVVEKDLIKEEALKTAGYYVMRFTDGQILKDLLNVIQEIEKQICLLEEKSI